MSARSRFLVIGTLALLVGCTTSDQRIASPEPTVFDDADLAFVDFDAVRKMQPQGAPFTQGLRVGYLDLAQELHGGTGTTRALQHFGRKAVASAKGQNVQPDMVSYRRLSESAKTELGAARARLMSFLDFSGRLTAPADAAKAQVAYDCWLEATEAGNQARIARCKATFEQAITASERVLGPTTTPSGERQYLAFFAWNSTELSPVTRQLVDQTAADFKAGRSTRLHLAGHADTSGSARYNMGLSERRARAVARALQAQGVPASALDIKWYGETRPLVPTGDGVREERNRRVEITYD